MDPVRLVVVLAVLGVVVGGSVWYRRRPVVAPEVGVLPLLPEGLRGPGGRSWVVFTTPYCATCGPLEAELRRRDAGSTVVKVDASADPELAARYQVRRAPTVLLADGSGRVEQSFATAEAVRTWLDEQLLAG